MTQISVAEAARLVRRDRKSLYRDIKAGRLSATIDATGARQVETSELVRVYGEIRVSGDTPATVALPQPATLDATAKIAALEAENEQLKARLADKESHIIDLRNAVQRLEYTPKPRRWWQF
jgi:hypothetical protein